MTDGNKNVLGGFPLFEGERRGIQIADETIQDFRDKGSQCLVGSLGVLKKLTNEAFKAVLLRIWRPGGRVVFNEIQENLWLFKFPEESDKHKVLAGRP
jgi:hypothetical protein